MCPYHHHYNTSTPTIFWPPITLTTGLQFWWDLKLQSAWLAIVVGGMRSFPSRAVGHTSFVRFKAPTQGPQTFNPQTFWCMNLVSHRHGILKLYDVNILWYEISVEGDNLFSCKVTPLDTHNNMKIIWRKIWWTFISSNLQRDMSSYCRYVGVNILNSRRQNKCRR